MNLIVIDPQWGGAWPKGNTPINWSEDQYRLSHDGIGSGGLYATTVSPWFFTVRICPLILCRRAAKLSIALQLQELYVARR